MQSIAHIFTVKIFHDWVSEGAGRKFVRGHIGVAQPGSIILGRVGLAIGLGLVHLGVGLRTIANSINVVNVDV